MKNSPTMDLFSVEMRRKEKTNEIKGLFYQASP